MIRKKLWIVLLIFSLISLVTSTGCTSDKNPIIGKWQGNDQQSGVYTWEFLDGGELMITIEEHIYGATWRTIDNDHIEITMNTSGLVNKTIIETSFSQDKTKVTITGLGESLILYKTTSIPVFRSQTDMSADLHTVHTAVGTYAIQSNKWPTASDNLPNSGNVTIDFNASFVNDWGKTMRFYPDFISKLPRHSDEGVWQIDSAGVVSINMAPGDKY